MGLYTPPPGEENHNKPKIEKVDPKEHDDDNNNSNILFYSRPSIGLRLWGPLVPASDCNWGLWLLTGTQITVGYIFLRRFRVSMKNYFMNRPITKQIKDIPSLNRFSQDSTGTIQFTKQSNGHFGGAQTFHIQRSPSKLELFTNKYKSSKWYKYIGHLTRFTYLLLGSVLTSLAVLEAMRLLLLDYDPWAEQAKAAREQQFYNDANQYYREGIDPSKTRIRVKDPSSGKLIDITNDDSLRSNIAMARAGVLHNKFFFEWFGPVNMKPFDFNEFLTFIEQYEMNKEAMKEAILANPKRLLKEQDLQNCKKLELALDKQNRDNRETFLNMGTKTLGHQMAGTVSNTTNSSPVVILPPNARDPDHMAFIDTWETNEPWNRLGLDIHMSARFIPSSTVYHNNDENFDDDDNSNDSDEKK
ncbi:i-AAA protease complex subunit Mgr1 [Hanseniaspora valbyensis NRRL Y-1626]|uniref:I-AAA protease complex subunit Mgr1 n=1 Tax=Hanseniaspora valbyensis NRRL Y-1626 TaxID=766949 RepID=A0A1B7TCH9_9ASCO|nr:i-AAA protease complex subunit Mgr1 [Hanseniaspora valbyensis NRRL Y-1626]